MARKKTRDNPFLSDGIIINVLSRLPAKCAMRCRLVCRGWRDLTSDRHFIDLHLRRRPPTILVANHRDHSGIDLFALDNCPEPTGTGFTIHRFPFHSGKFSNNFRELFSHDGLVVLQENYFTPLEPKFVILNPVWPECVTISFPKKLMRSTIHGVYFHPLSKEYCSLWRIYESGPSYDQPKRVQYKILCLSSNPSLKTISNPFSDKAERWYGKPVLINNYLYWLLESQCPQGSKYTGRNDIMEFDIIREEFVVIPCPVPLDTMCRECQTLLLNIDGILSFLVVYGCEILVWRLEGHADKLWTTAKYSLSIEICRSLARRNGIRISPLPIAVVNGELALKSGEKLLVCNLMEGTVKNYPRKEYRNIVYFFSHQMSLASLKNCKSTISIDKDGEVVV